MRRVLVETPTFVRALKRLRKTHPELGPRLREVLGWMEADAHDPRLRTHKLKGEWSERWSCSVAYDLRIIFRFIEHEGAGAILLQNIGTHNEVY